MDIVEESAPIEPLAPPVDEESSLADHEASFGQGGTGQPPRMDDPDAGDTESVGERDDKGRFRHRATSQKASAEDVPQINALTRDLRAKEEELRKAKPEALTGSPRVLALKRQIRALELDLADLKPKPIAPLVTPVAASAPAPAVEFTDKEPVLDDFASEPDPYAAYVRSLARFDRKKEQWDADQVSRAAQSDTARREQQQQDQQIAATYVQRQQAFAATHPDFDRLLDAVSDRPVPVALAKAVMTADNGPAFVYHLAQHPEFFDEMLALTFDKPVSDPLVALVQRRLSARVSAASTGSATATRAPSPAPRPPNPVRTGPMNTGDDLPGDESSLAEHEKAFGPKRRR